MSLDDLFDLHDLSAEELRAALIELCECGLLTCTHSAPGSDNATYALAWAPLDSPDAFTQAVREQHTENMQRLSIEAPWFDLSLLLDKRDDIGI